MLWAVAADAVPSPRVLPSGASLRCLLFPAVFWEAQVGGSGTVPLRRNVSGVGDSVWSGPAALPWAPCGWGH